MGVPLVETSTTKPELEDSNPAPGDNSGKK